MKKISFNYEFYHLLNNQVINNLHTHINKKHINPFYSDNIIFLWVNNLEILNEFKNKLNLNYYSFNNLNLILKNFRSKYNLVNLLTVNPILDSLLNLSNSVIYFDDNSKLDLVLKFCKEVGDSAVSLAYISNNYLNVLNKPWTSGFYLNLQYISFFKSLPKKHNMSSNLKDKLSIMLNLGRFFKFNLKILYFITRKIILNINAYNKSIK